ncbi:MAG: S-methyl-5-thioribose kinase [Paracoccaceae bacterium]
MTDTAYAPLTPVTLSARLSKVALIRDRLGDPADWSVREVGDGNLNLVFIVEGPAGSVVVKQALPYVRLVGESWPLPLNRSFFEYHALTRQESRDPGSVPQVFHFNESQAIIAMEYLAPHVILRTGLIDGHRYPGVGQRLGRFCARTLFRGSDLSMTAAARKADLALFAGNVALCDITENLVFTDPYFDAPLNRHTPGLDAAVATLRTDLALKIAAQHLKMAFANKAETMLHGDLHTGSVMVSDSDVRVIDPEFATYGPMGFDVGMLISNFLMAALSQPGHADRPGARDDHSAWILGESCALWDAFADEFTRLWRTERTGMLYPASLYEDQGHALAAEAALADRLSAIWQDAMGFCGVEIHRRILGLAHNADFERIADPARRATCERRALSLGRLLVLTRSSLAGMQQVEALARTHLSADISGA